MIFIDTECLVADKIMRLYLLMYVFHFRNDGERHAHGQQPWYGDEGRSEA